MTFQFIEEWKPTALAPEYKCFAVCEACGKFDKIDQNEVRFWHENMAMWPRNIAVSNAIAPLVHRRSL